MAVFFSEGFESTNLAANGWYDNTTAILVSDASPGGGTKSAQFRWTAGLSGNSQFGAAARHAITPTNSVYISYWIKHSLNWVGNLHVWFLLTNLNAAYDGFAWSYLTSYFEENNRRFALAIQDGRNINASYLRTAPATPPAGVPNIATAGGNGTYADGYSTCAYWLDGSDYYNFKYWFNSSQDFGDTVGSYGYKGDWHFVEVYFQLNSVVDGIAQQDGIMRAWLDGAQRMNMTNIVLRNGAHSTQQFNQIALGPWMGETSAVDQWFQIDNLTVADARQAMTIPTISSVSGTVSAGQTLTVSGANMINQSTTGWDPFFVSNPSASGFEGASFEADGYAPVSVNSGTATYQSSVFLTGTKAARFEIDGTSSWPSDEYKSTTYVWVGTPYTGELWSRHYIRFDLHGGVWTSPGGKSSWYEGGPWGFNPRPQNGTIAAWVLAVGDAAAEPPSGPFEAGRWYCIEEHILPGQRMELYCDNVLIITINTTAPLSARWYEFGVVNGWDDSGRYTHFSHYQDSYAVARGNNRIRPASIIEIANGSNYATATKRQQAPLFLSDGSSQAKADLTGLGAGPYYLFVTNNLNERSAGYSLSGGTVIAPVASFSASAVAGQAPLIVTLTDTSSNTPTSWAWDFDTSANNWTTPDTASTAGPHDVTYDYGGAFNTRLAVTNSAGSDVEDKALSVRYLKPTNFQAS